MAEKNNKHEKNIPILSHEIIMLAKKLYEKFDGDKGVIQTIDEFLDFITVDQHGNIHFSFPDTWVGSYDNDTAYGLDNSINPTPTSEDKDYVRIFGDLSIDDLNKAIKQFEAEFEDKPYLIMSKDTLRIFEQYANNTLEATSCLNFDTNNIDCEDYDECIGCPYEPEEEGTVFIEHDCESGNSTACYFHNDEDYTITIDNDLAFGVVKVR